MKRSKSPAVNEVLQEFRVLLRQEGGRKELAVMGSNGHDLAFKPRNLREALGATVAPISNMAYDGTGDCEDNQKTYERLKDCSRYVRTSFFTVQAADGRQVAVQTQPYLNHDEYGYYDPDAKMGAKKMDELAALGVADLSDENVYIHKKTRRLVLFDCIS